MKCYYDPAQDALGICKHCGKALSAPYAADTGHGLACRGTPCEEAVRSMAAGSLTGSTPGVIIEAARSTLRVHQRSRILIIVSLLFWLILFLVFGPRTCNLRSSPPTSVPPAGR